MKKRSRWRFAPTRRLALVVAVSSLLWLLSSSTLGVNLSVAALVLLLGAAIGDAIFLPPAHRIRLVRTLPRSIGVGDDVEVRYELASLWPQKMFVRVFDALPHSITREGEFRAEALLRPGGTLEFTFFVVATERGEHQLGPVVLECTGPLGLMRRLLRYEPGDVVTVTPSLSGVRRYRLLSLQRRLRDAGVRAIRRRGEGTSFSNLRDYVRGDDPRHIDWKASARRRHLISREHTVEQGQAIMIAVDAGRMMLQMSGDLARFEHALSSALVLADVAVHSKDFVGLIVFDDHVRAFVPPSRGRIALEGIRSALIRSRATLVEPDYAMAFRTIETRHRKRSLIVLFTDVIDARSSQSILAHTARSAARHLPLVVALRNDHLVAAADPGGLSTSSELYQSASAEELISAREEALLRMRRSGVSVLDVSPGDMTAAVINRYLELKSRAQL